jgi:ABC-type glycerol-3-phosphate transport system substrate-binding protein
MRWVIACVTGAVLVVALAACGAGGSGKGPVTLNWYVFPEPSGSFAKGAADCSAASGGRYTVSVQTLPRSADDQRTQLVRRLAAKDSAIDLVGMDVIWTAEFAEAKWILPWTGTAKAGVERGTLPGPLKTATYKGKLYAAPANSNTQLLWYRDDLVKTPPKTWAEMIQMARDLAKQGKPHLIEIQGRPYEGFTVWFNSLLNSAGGQVLDSAGKVALGAPALQAAGIMRDLAKSPGADPSLTTQQEDQNRLAFEGGSAAFELNYPFVYPSAKADVPKIFKVMKYAPWPSVDPGRQARVSIGGSNFGVAAYSKHKALAFEAAACLRNAANQKRAAVAGGLPPTLNRLYDDPSVRKAYPFADLIRQQLAVAGIRPVSPVYSDISLAIQKALTPPASINPRSVVNKLKDQVNKALGSEALL